ncbi:hypothetical protein B0H19DRAFT_416771 [Mycena capillaripes]|nr:hypothetical protein B0H19DRAFT_416771 [Mycena capillaripes]
MASTFFETAWAIVFPNIISAVCTHTFSIAELVLLWTTNQSSLFFNGTSMQMLCFSFLTYNAAFLFAS